jgi:hypothetical protein
MIKGERVSKQIKNSKLFEFPSLGIEKIDHQRLSVVADDPLNTLSNE